MRKLTLLAIIGVLFAATSAWALTADQIKLYVEKSFNITKQLKAMKDLQKAREIEINKIRIKYNYDTMMAEIKTINDLYNPQINDLNSQYNILVNELENQ